MPQFLIFDTETTGLPKDFNAPMTKLDNWPRVIQLAWVRCDQTGFEISRGKYLIEPDGWVIPSEKFWTDNGFFTDDSIVSGVPIFNALFDFLYDLKQCDYLVSHNIQFDKPVLGAEIIRAKLPRGKKLPAICTKLYGTDFCKIPSPYGGLKWPKLIELHTKLFGRGFDGAHDALADVIACKDCFFEMLKRNIIKL